MDVIVQNALGFKRGRGTTGKEHEEKLWVSEQNLR